MKVLITRNSLQAYYHLRDNFHLGAFLTNLLKALHLVAFSSSQDLVTEALADYDVLVITTRPTEQTYHRFRCPGIWFDSASRGIADFLSDI